MENLLVLEIALALVATLSACSKENEIETTDLACVAGEYSCQVRALRICNDSRTGWIDVENCGEGKRCDVLARSCIAETVGQDGGGAAGKNGSDGGVPDGCVPGTCESMGKNCGPTPDGCGGKIASCGTCPAAQSCGGGGTPNVCGGCVPDTCEAHSYKCGTMPDGCGNTISCGPPATNAGPGDACNAVGMPETWKCGSYQPFPMPKPDCILPWENATFYCCPST